MENQKVNVNLSENQKELTIINRTGEAEIIVYPKQQVLTGTITAPRLYRQFREKEFSVENTTIEYNYDRGEIYLKINSRDIYQSNVTGKLVENPDIARIGINTQKEYGAADLIRMLKMNRILFPEKDKHEALLTNISKFKLEVQQNIERQQVERGNKKELNEVTVKSDIPLDFNLEMPLFKGEKKVKFRTSICFDVRSGAISFWLESVELKELLDGGKQAIIDKELEAFKDIVCIELL